MTPEGRAVKWIANNDGRVVCKKDGDDKLMITGLTLMIDAAVAQAVSEAVKAERERLDDLVPDPTEVPKSERPWVRRLNAALRAEAGR